MPPLLMRRRTHDPRLILKPPPWSQGVRTMGKIRSSTRAFCGRHPLFLAALVAAGCVAAADWKWSAGLALAGLLGVGLGIALHLRRLAPLPVNY